MHAKWQAMIDKAGEKVFFMEAYGLAFFLRLKGALWIEQDNRQAQRWMVFGYAVRTKTSAYLRKWQGCVRTRIIALSRFAVFGKSLGNLCSGELGGVDIYNSYTTY